MKSIYLLLFMLLTLFLSAKEKSASSIPKFQQLDLHDGLSNLNVTSIVQDDLGYMWIATARGLNRYDGTTFKHYTYSNEANSLYNDMVTKLHKNNEGIIFCSSIFGLNTFDTKKNKMFRIGTVHDHFFDFIDYNHTTYGVSYLSGLCVFNKTKNTFERLPHIANDKLLNHLISDKKTGVWASSVKTVRGFTQHTPNSGTKTSELVLVNYNPHTNRFTKFEIPPIDGEYSSGPIVKVDSLILLSGNRMSTFNLNSLKFIPFPKKWSKLNQLQNHEIQFLKQIDENTLWIGTRTKGLFIFNLETNTLVNLNKTNSDISSNFIRCIFNDRDGNIWLGSFEHGLEIAFKDRGNINSDNTLNKLTHDKFINHITSDSLTNNIYIGSRNHGFYIYNSVTKTAKNFHTGNSFLTSNNIRKILIDSQHKLWVADQKALHVTDIPTNHLKEYRIPVSNEGMGDLREWGGKVFACSGTQGFFVFDLDGNLIKQEMRLGANISQIIPLNKKDVIVASYTKGIFLYTLNTGSYTNIYNPNQSKEKAINQTITVHLDADSILWIGNYVDGLHKLDLKNNTIKVYTIEDGLSNNDIVGIVEDNSGALWLSTSYGISRFDKKHEFVNYFYNEGLENLQFHAKSAHIDKNGIVYFGGSSGLSYFNPEELFQSINKKAPEIILESLTVQNKEVMPGDETNILSTILSNTADIELDHRQNSITIAYHAFDYVAADEIKYSYILQGLDKVWTHAGKRRIANFSNLKPGKYTFKVKAKNNKGVRSNISSLKIRVKPSPFLSFWAIGFYLVLMITIIYISFQLRLRAKLYKSKLEFEHYERKRENEVAQMKMRFFSNISHEIRTPLTLIKGNVDLLSRDLTENTIKINTINALRYSTNRLLGLVNQLLSVRKLENDALDLKVKKGDIIRMTECLIQPFSYITSSKDVTIEISTELDKLMLPIDEDKYEKIMSNLLSNAVKHVEENGEIKVKIETIEGSEIGSDFINESVCTDCSYVKISVIDNGVGIPQKDLAFVFDRFTQSKIDRSKPDNSGTGIGLDFTKRLVELHHGVISVSSIKNKETIFSFVLPLSDKVYDKDAWVSAESAVMSKIQEGSPPEINDVDENKEKALILLIEDDLELNRFITSSLKNYFKVISCFNGKEGINLAQNLLPALIISDIMMPKMDGFEMCKRIRQDQLISHLPIILLTAKTDAESKIAGYTYGADDYISKPFDQSILIARINNLIESRKKLQASYKQGFVEREDANITNEFELNFVKKIQAIVEAEFHSTELNVNYLAKTMNMSRTNFYRKFVSVMDVAPKDFIKKYRINKSIELMKTGKESFSEISHLCGFGSQSNYSAIFKKEKGISPLQYKKTL